MTRHRTQSGFTLVEWLVATSISATLIGALLQIVLAATSGFRLQQSLGQVTEDARFAMGLLAGEVRAAGFVPQPWLEPGFTAIGNATEDTHSARGDRLELRRRSALNCMDQPNPVTDASGWPAYFLRVTAFYVNSAGDLAMRCAYGADDGALVIQINGLGLVRATRRFDVQFEIRAAPGALPEWVDAGNWPDSRQVRAVRIALWVRSEYPVGAATATSVPYLDGRQPVPADGRLDQVFETAVTLRSRR